MFTCPKLNFLCGPPDDIKPLQISFSPLRRRIGVFVSGGLDSALLYYLIKSLETENYTVTPYSIIRNDGSDKHAQPVINFINEYLHKPIQKTNWIQISPETTSHYQVSEGLKILLSDSKINLIYMGIIKTLPEHSIGFPIYTPNDQHNIIYPFKDLTKSHIVDLVIKLGITRLFEITHSCVYYNGRCGECNRCKERYWAFSRLSLTDPGIN